jgi:glycosyltransferase involved in cell wall biosynthesis
VTGQDRSGRDAMRIALDLRHFDPSSSGQQRYKWRLGIWLAARGHDVHFLTIRQRMAHAEPPPGVRLHRLEAVPRTQLRAFLHELRPDILMLNPERSRRYRGIPANVLRPGYGTDHYSQKLRSFRHPLMSVARRMGRLTPWAQLERRWERAFYEARTPQPEVIAVSHYMRREILASYDIPPDHVHVVHNGVDLTEFSPAARARLRAEQRQAWGIPDGAVCLLFIGHNFRLKGLWELAEVVRQIRTGTGGGDVHLLVAGKGTSASQRRMARRLAELPGLKGALHLGGAVSPAMRAYAAADALVHLTWHDSFGFVALEAMASGLPVITTPFAGAAELIEDGVSGLLVQAGDPDAVAAAVRRLLDAGLRDGMGRAAAVVAAAHPEEANFGKVLAVMQAARSRDAATRSSRPA